MVKIDMMVNEEAEREFAKIPEVVRGRWAKLCEEVKKDKTSRRVSDITRGQAWALKRTATEKGLRIAVQSLKGGKAVVLVLPP